MTIQFKISPVPLSKRGLRYKDIIPLGKISRSKCLIVGCGAIGRQVAIQLVTIGIKHLSIWDPDKVTRVNLGPQGYSPHDLKNYKVHATSGLCKYLNPSTEILCHPLPYSLATNNKYPFVFCCVDSMHGRKDIFSSINKHTYKLFIDGRMSAEAIRIVSVVQSKHKETDYLSTLIDDTAALEESCTKKSTFYAATIAAALMVKQYVIFIRDIDLDTNIEHNLLSNEVFVKEEFLSKTSATAV